MINYQEAVSEILSNVQVMPSEEKPLLKCLGQAASSNSMAILPQGAIINPGDKVPVLPLDFYL